MICAVVRGPTYTEAHNQISTAISVADMVELRLDFFDFFDSEDLIKLRSSFTIPMIFTLRSHFDGGNYKQSEETRLDAIQNLAALKPEYLDVESHVSNDFIRKISKQHPEIKLILSYHNFEETPKDLEGIYQSMRNTPAFFYKIAVKAHNSIDALRLICWCKDSKKDLIAISMGEPGQISRILGPITGCPITYAALEEDQGSAPGQLTASTLNDRYQYPSLNSKSFVYGLIGDPVKPSISDETHNDLMAACGLDAVYVKIQITPSELSDFMHYARQIPFRGLSVTMPLKEKILPLLDAIDPQAREIGAVNTLIFENEQVKGYNTDGLGALNALEKDCVIKNKRIVIIGAGGSTKAIAYEACQRGAFVTILNRTADKAIQLAQSLNCRGYGIVKMKDCFEEGYDALINCTPHSEPIESKYVIPGSLVMDIKTKPKESDLIKQAKKKNCQIVYGYEMFIEQALGQFDLWFNNRINIDICREIIETKALDVLKEGIENI